MLNILYNNIILPSEGNSHLFEVKSKSKVVSPKWFTKKNFLQSSLCLAPPSERHFHRWGGGSGLWTSYQGLLSSVTGLFVCRGEVGWWWLKQTPIRAAGSVKAVPVVTVKGTWSLTQTTTTEQFVTHQVLYHRLHCWWKFVTEPKTTWRNRVWWR